MGVRIVGAGSGGFLLVIALTLLRQKIISVADPLVEKPISIGYIGTKITYFGE